MASGALFGNASGRSASKNLVEFRAGKMYLKGKMVNPDKRKGLVYIYQSDDSLMHFCWKDRTKGTVEDDLIIFPDDCEFKHVKQCTTGRVYLLRFKSTSRKFFFWMQEPKVDQDDDLCKKVNDNLNSPPTPGASRGGSAGPLGGLPPEVAAGLGETDLQNLLGNMNQQQLMQLLGGMGMGGLGGLPALMGGRPSSAQSESTPPSRVQSSPGPRSGTESTPQAARPVTAVELSSQTQTPVDPAPTTTPAAPTHATQPVSSTPASVAASATGATSPQIQLSDLQNILSGLGGDAAMETACKLDPSLSDLDAQENAQGAGERRTEIDLSSALTPETMIPILANADVQERLIPFLPEGESLPKTEEELRNTVSSPQFQQAMSSFSAALASGQLGPLMGQFELGDDVSAAAAQGDVSAFVTAMQANLAKKEEEKKEEK